MPTTTPSVDELRQRLAKLLGHSTGPAFEDSAALGLDGTSPAASAAEAGGTGGSLAFDFSSHAQGEAAEVAALLASIADMEDLQREGGAPASDLRDLRAEASQALGEARSTLGQPPEAVPSGEASNEDEQVASLLAELEDELALGDAKDGAASGAAGSGRAAGPLLTSWADYGPGFVDDVPGAEHEAGEQQGKRQRGRPHKAGRRRRPGDRNSHHSSEESDDDADDSDDGKSDEDSD